MWRDFTLIHSRLSYDTCCNLDIIKTVNKSERIFGATKDSMYLTEGREKNKTK